MDILLAHAYFLADDPAEQRVMKPYAPLGILSIAAYLDQQHFTSGVFDSTFRSLNEFVSLVQREHPPFVGISINMVTKFRAIEMMHIAKKAGSCVIVGGPEPVYYAEQFLQEGADIVVIGEGEATVEEILTAGTENRESWKEIHGLVFRDDAGQIVRTPARTPFSDLDQLPLPARSKIDLSPYLSAWRGRHGFSSLSLISMRGCPYTCTWCSHAVYGVSHRKRSPIRLVDEIEQIVKQYAPDALWFADDVFTINHPWLYSWAEEMERRGIHVPYECITRADRMNEQVVQTLKSTGCTRVWIGSESGSQRILDAMDRKVTVEQVQKMCRLAREHGIQVGMFIMLGYTGETRADIEETVDHVRRSRPDHLLTTLSYPIRGTTYYDTVQEEITLPEVPFSLWNDRMIAVGGRYSNRFYWFAHRRLANEASLARIRSRGGYRWRDTLVPLLKSRVAKAGMLLTS